MSDFAVLERELRSGKRIRAYRSGSGVCCVDTRGPSTLYGVSEEDTRYEHIEALFLLDALCHLEKVLQGTPFQGPYSQVGTSQVKTALGEHLRRWGSFELAYQNGEFYFYPSAYSKSYQPVKFESLVQLINSCPELR